MEEELNDIERAQADLAEARKILKIICDHHTSVTDADQMVRLAQLHLRCAEVAAQVLAACAAMLSASSSVSMTESMKQGLRDNKAGISAFVETMQREMGGGLGDLE